MGIQDSDKVDAVGFEMDADTVVLTMLDALDWGDAGYHIEKLEEKFDSYIHYISSGQLLSDFPRARNKIVRIDLISMHEIPPAGQTFLDAIVQSLLEMGVALSSKTETG